MSIKRVILWSSLLLLLCPSCMITEVIGIIPEQTDTVVIEKSKPYKQLPPRDTTETEDTARIPITFNPTVEDWDKQDINL